MFANNIGPLIIKLAVVPVLNINLLPVADVDPTTSGAALADGAPTARYAASLRIAIAEANELFVRSTVGFGLLASCVVTGLNSSLYAHSDLPVGLV